MKVIGLCGGSGSGKGTVAALLEKYRIPSIDTDAIYHEITSKKSDCLDELVLEFGEEILIDGSSLNRKALANIVFAVPNSDKVSLLNKITHKYVLAEVRKNIAALEKSGFSAVLVDAPMLFESGFNSECHKVIGVLADHKIRVARIMERDKISYDAAQRRISSQLSDEYLQEKCDYTIVNNGDISVLSRAVDKLAEKILN